MSPRAKSRRKPRVGMPAPVRGVARGVLLSVALVGVLVGCGRDDGALAVRFAALDRAQDGGPATVRSEGHATVRLVQVIGEPDPDAALLTIGFDDPVTEEPRSTLRCFGMQDGACVFEVRSAEGVEERITVPAGGQVDVFPGGGPHGVRIAVD